MTLYIGLMSGTSMDGVDAALVDLAQHRCIAGITRPYSESTIAQLMHVLHSGTVELAALAQLNTLIGREFADAVLLLLDKARYERKDVIAVGSHGQTIAHDAFANPPYTLQIGCPHTIAEKTGIQVVADFRTRDVIVGGQGAPFAPLYHQILFSEHDASIGVVNIGGIANVTVLTPGEAPRGYDVGPGNCLMDAWILAHQSKKYDENGDWAALGKVHQPLLQAMLKDPFFTRIPPKSIGKEYFSLEWLNSLMIDVEAQDVQATLLELTAQLIANALIDTKISFKTIILCGGGVHNTALLRSIRSHFKQAPVVSSQTYGINPDFIEAMMFAWLAKQAIQGRALDLRALTGAKKLSILGVLYQGG